MCAHQPSRTFDHLSAPALGPHRDRPPEAAFLSALRQEGTIENAISLSYPGELTKARFLFLELFLTYVDSFAERIATNRRVMEAITSAASAADSAHLEQLVVVSRLLQKLKGLSSLSEEPVAMVVQCALHLGELFGRGDDAPW